MYEYSKVQIFMEKKRWSKVEASCREPANRAAFAPRLRQDKTAAIKIVSAKSGNIEYFWTF